MSKTDYGQPQLPLTTSGADGSPTVEGNHTPSDLRMRCVSWRTPKARSYGDSEYNEVFARGEIPTRKGGAKVELTLENQVLIREKYPTRKGFGGEGNERERERGEGTIRLRLLTMLTKVCLMHRCLSQRMVCEGGVN